MKFSVIIPSKDRKEILVESLERLSRVNNLKDLQVIVVNDSEEELILGEEFAFVVVYRNIGRGVASARNIGAAQAANEWLIFMDDDMWVDPDTFQKVIPFCNKEDQCLNINWTYPDSIVKDAASKPFLRYLHTYGFDSLEGWNRGEDWNPSEPFEVNGITSQFLLIHRYAFEKVGGYNTLFPLAGFEDHDFSQRLKKKNIKIFIDPCNVIYHNEADRLEIESWLERKRRGAVTRRVGVSLGFGDLRLHYSFFKRSAYSIMYWSRTVWLTLLKSYKGKRIDNLYFLMVNALLGSYSYAGYTGSEAKEYIRSIETS